MSRFTPGETVLVPWLSDPSGFIEGEVVSFQGYDIWSNPTYLIKPKGAMHNHQFSDSEITRLQSTPHKVDSKCDCGLSKFPEYADASFHSDHCKMKRGL